MPGWSCGGDRPGGDLAAGNFVNPTLFADVDNSMSIAREEIFGPVLGVIPFKDEDEAIRIANDTAYGLGASRADHRHQRRLPGRQGRARRHLRHQRLHRRCPTPPSAAIKQSGLGREGGRESIEAFTELKTIIAPLGDNLF